MTNKILHMTEFSIGVSDIRSVNIIEHSGCWVTGSKERPRQYPPRVVLNDNYVYSLEDGYTLLERLFDVGYLPETIYKSKLEYYKKLVTEFRSVFPEGDGNG